MKWKEIPSSLEELLIKKRSATDENDFTSKLETKDTS